MTVFVVAMYWLGRQSLGGLLLVCPNNPICVGGYALLSRVVSFKGRSDHLDDLRLGGNKTVATDIPRSPWESLPVAPMLPRPTSVVALAAEELPADSAGSTAVTSFGSRLVVCGASLQLFGGSPSRSLLIASD